MAPKFHKEPEFDTIQVHGGQSPDPATGARAVPIYATTSFVFDNTQHGADLFSLKKAGHIYSRIGNPTVSVFEDRVAALEGGIAAVAAASGQAAQFMAISAITNVGDNIVSSSFLYGGTYNQFKVTLKKYGIGVTFVTDLNPESFAKAIDDKTKAIFIESIANPKSNVLDISALAKVAHDNEIPLIVDNTFGMGGWLVRPFDHGADLIVHSATKWMGGSGTTIGGVVVDGGTFDWTRGKFPGFTKPSEGYHGLIFSEAFGAAAFAAKVRTEILRDVGPAMNPVAAFSFCIALESLSLRAERHCSNALQLAQWLVKQPNVDCVSYLGLRDHESYGTAEKYLRKGCFGSVFTLSVKGDAADARKTVDNLMLCSHLANVGDSKTLVIHPASTTHSQLTEEEQREAGVLPEQIRVSVGIEDIRDIIADFEAALNIAFGEQQ